MLRRTLRVDPTLLSQACLHLHHAASICSKTPDFTLLPSSILLLTTNMSHNHDHHDHHGHDHSEGAAHDHTDDLTPALQNNIYEQVDFSAINTLNESESRAGAKIVQKTWTERLEPDPELKSDADEQLLMHIPYVPLATLCVVDTCG